MKILFIHQNFPGQYPHLARYLERMGGHQVVGLGETVNIRRRGVIKGITSVGYPTPRGAGSGTHHYLQDTEAAVRRGQAVALALLELKKKGFTPDVVSLHPGWGEGLFVRDVFPETPILMFCEFYFQAGEADMAFDPELPRSDDFSFSIRMRNSAQVVSLLSADAFVSPTRWQASRYPDFVQRAVHIIHDGINSAYMTPGPEDSLTLQPLAKPGESRLPGCPPPARPDEGRDKGPDKERGKGRDAGQDFTQDAGRKAAQAPPPEPEIPRGPPLTLRAADKIVTYVARNLEPYRGIHIFLRSLPELQRRHPDAHILIVGGEGTSYSPSPPDGKSYKKRYLDELAGRLDLERIHFLGRIPYQALRSLFRISSAHVYLTYPFALSWSMLEAMACEALVLASDTPPVREMIRHGANGLLFDFFDAQALAELMDQALSEPERFMNLRREARRFVTDHLSLERCLPKHYALLRAVAQRDLGALNSGEA